MLDWDDLRIFLVLARMRKAAPAAQALGIDVTTLSRRITRLQSALNASLFETIGGERRLTERGETLFAHAEEVESATLAAIGDVSGDSSSLSGHVRLSVAEGFATWVLAPALPAFQQGHPEIRLDLVTASGFLNPSKREADMAVMLARPRSGRLVASKLGNYSLRLYAAATYLAARHTPDRIEDLRRHPLIGYVPEFIYSPELDYLSEVGAGLSAAARSTSINVQHRLIASGTGIGVLPAFIGDRDPSLRPLLPDLVNIRRSFWLVTHSDLRRLARIEAVADWLKSSVIGMT
ncbi:LysR family transcriptional regulator [Sphingomonas sp. SRS2]|uniref:LysR family transcriptional regulator n=1 Tax=Sphingomonas sp. SRS2 TaxID=133190 RepID=UPI0006184EC1|nr:LysR family transcriptional regulator [Sphingomonas sp. SRS2]KKC27296.1 LysR family transcriptional regulator [Sphingomonas sp. SRS2]